ncbi:glycosyltransferase [Pokkaliibacter sp. CJK22405]|uniref:glycosyltransferase n=1 Tax=Pokkaliibacter sp. CJK22405 TaxID=3384615 RepID=UPI003984CAC5
MSQPLHIAQLMLSSQNGGAETFFEKLALALADRGVKQHLYIEPDERRMALFANHPMLEVVPIRFRGIHEPLGHLKLHASLMRHRPQALLTWMSRAIKRAPTRYCPVIARLGGYYRVPRYRKATRLVGNTPDIVRYLVEEGIPADKALCIPNFGEVADSGMSRDEARRRLRAEFSIPDNHQVLLNLGRLHKAKAQDVLIAALAQTSNTTLLIAGDGALRPDFEAQISALGLTGRVHLLGWRRDTAYLFAGADLCVFPSREEPFGNVVVEAWSQQTPLIAARSQGPAWLIEDQRTGLLVDIDDAEGLAAAIRDLQFNPEKAQQLAIAGQQRFEEAFSADAICAQYIELFKSLRPE